MGRELSDLLLDNLSLSCLFVSDLRTYFKVYLSELPLTFINKQRKPRKRFSLRGFNVPPL
jgi:hypothetical protein